jgi:hypothetical protein
MERTEKIILAALVVLAVCAVAQTQFGHSNAVAPTAVVEQTSSSSDGDAKAERAAKLAMLKKYSKLAPAYEAPHAEEAPVVEDAGPVTTEVSPITPPTVAPAPATPPVTTPATPNATQDNTTQDTYPTQPDDTVQLPVAPDDYTRALTEAQLSDPWNLSDQQLVDGMVGMLGPDDRDVFQNMWVSLTPDERQEWLFELRTSLSP